MSKSNKNKSKKHQSKMDFKGMAFFFKIRDVLKPPIQKIKKSKIKPGDYVLDYGCGPGSYSFAAIDVIGASGKIYCADIHPVAIESVKKKAAKKGLSNMETILTDCNTNLPNNSIDVIICFDVMHAIDDQSKLLKEFHRVLKSNGFLSFDDHHYEEEEIMNIISADGLFELTENIDNFYNFKKKKNASLNE